MKKSTRGRSRSRRRMCRMRSVITLIVAALVVADGLRKPRSSSLPPSPSKPRTSTSNPAGRSSTTATAITWWTSSASTTSPANAARASTARTTSPPPIADVTVPETRRLSVVGALRISGLLRSALPRRRRSRTARTVLDHVMGTKNSLRYGLRRADRAGAARSVVGTGRIVRGSRHACRN